MIECTLFFIKLFFVSLCLSLVGACTFRTIISPNLLLISYYTLSLTLYPLRCWYDFLMCEKFCLQAMISIAVSIHEYISSAGSVLPLSHLTSCIPTKYNLYFAYSLDPVFGEADCIGFSHLRSKPHVHFPWCMLFHRIFSSPGHHITFCYVLGCYGEELLATC
jgi:hypothetical protein